MDEIVFFPDSGGGFIGGLAVVLVLLGVLVAVGLVRNRERAPDQTVWFAPVFLIGLGVLLGWFVFGEAKAVTVIPPTTIELRFVWPRPNVVLDVRDVAAVRVEYRGTKRPSPRLVIELRRGDTYESEGTSRGDRVNLAKARIEQLLLRNE